MLINPGQIWTLARRPNGKGMYLRSATAIHTSPAVKAQNRKLAKAAQDCKGKKGAEFRTCVAEKIKK
jgi:hypothetical protein